MRRPAFLAATAGGSSSTAAPPGRSRARQCSTQASSGSVRGGSPWLQRESVANSSYFAAKFGVDVRQRFSDAWGSLKHDGYLAEYSDDRVALTREGLLRVDMLLHRFFLEQHRGVRYT